MPVKLKRASLDRLADLYVAVPDPAAKEGVWRCVERINDRLAEGAQFLGESRGSALRRAWFHYPLVIIYDLPAGGGVYVNHVAGLRPCHDKYDADEG